MTNHWIGLLVLASCLSCPLVGWAAETVDQRLSAYLETGEFAPALRLARTESDRERRDLRLEQIALTQAAPFDRRASLSTLSEMRNDRARAKAIQAVRGAPGGGLAPDFEPLMELIRSTIAPTTWDDVGGPGSMREFEAAGVFVDAEGVLSRIERVAPSPRLVSLHGDRRPSRFPASQNDKTQDQDVEHSPGDVRRHSELRFVSLTRLEKEIQLLRAADREPTDAMRSLAGLQRIQYVLVYPETGDLVIAGSAGDWRQDPLGRIISCDTLRPVVLLDDLVVVTRHLAQNGRNTFGCTIDPTKEGLRRTQEYLSSKSHNTRSAFARKKWLREIRSRLGKQEIKVFGLEPETHAARVLVAADHHMKLIGMGLEEGVPGVESYLASIKLKRGEAPPPMDVLRWWFTLNYQSIAATPDRMAFEIRGTGVKVLSENQLLSEQGRRLATGRSDELNQQFANRFTKHFEELAVKYPIYAELQNLCDLALVGALIESEHLAEQVEWNRTEFGDPEAFQVARQRAPRLVESVINHRRINGVSIDGEKVIHTVAGVSGGVSVDPWPLVRPSAIHAVTDDYRLERAYDTEPPKLEPRGPWWWD